MEMNILFDNTHYDLYNVESSFREIENGRIVTKLKIAFSLYPSTQEDMDAIVNRCTNESPNLDIPKEFSNSKRTGVQVVIVNDDWYITLQNIHFAYSFESKLTDKEREGFIKYVDKWLKENDYRFYFSNIIEFSEISFEQFCNHNVAIDMIRPLFEMKRLYYSRY